MIEGSKKSISFDTNAARRIPSIEISIRQLLLQRTRTLYVCGNVCGIIYGMIILFFLCACTFLVTANKQKVK